MSVSTTQTRCAGRSLGACATGGRCRLVAICLLCVGEVWAQGNGKASAGLSSSQAELKLSQGLGESPPRQRRGRRRAGTVDAVIHLKLATGLARGTTTAVAPATAAAMATVAALQSPAQAGARPEAVASIDQPESPVPFDQVKPGPSSLGVAAAQAVESGLPDFSLIEGWATPPIRWGGNTGSMYNWNRQSGGVETLQNTDTLNLRAASYIYQPWYAQVAGDVGLVLGETAISGVGRKQRSDSTTVNYGGNLNLFPQSRFPFSAYVQQSDSRAHASNTGTHYTSSRFGMRQNYRPEVGAETYAGSYDHSDVISGKQRSVVESMIGSYNDTIGDQRIGANGQYSKTTGDAGGQGSELINLNASHTWNEDRILSISSSANLMNNTIRVLSRGGLVDNTAQLIQLNNSFSWLPDEDLPLTVNGGGNLLTLSSSTVSADNHLTNVQGFLSANYRVTPHLYATAAATLSRIYNNGFSLFGTTQTASLSYSGTPLVFGDYSYNWGGGGSGSNQFISAGVASRSVSGQAQHSLTRRVLTGEASTFLVTAGQSVSVNDGVGVGRNTTLTHSGGATWSQMLGGGSVGSMSATASDTLVSGDYKSHYRNVSLNGSIQKQLSGRSTVSTSANFVVNQQLKVPESGQTSPFSTQGSLNGTRTMNGAGAVTYSHRNPFDVQNLLYSASLMINMSQTNFRVVSGDPNALPWQTGSVFQQVLDYRVGRLSLRGTASVARQNGKENASVFFTMNRDFGGL